MNADPRSLRRIEDDPLLRGAAQYVDDLAPAGLLHAAILRSPHAHARIVAIDTASARAVPGVAGVFTAADLAPDGLGPIPCTAQVPTVGPMIVPDRYALAADRVRHVGEPVACVLAETLAAAHDALERIAVEYEILPAVTTVPAAGAPGAPLLHAAAPGNVSFHFQKGDRAGVDAAFAAAAHTVRLDLVNPRLIVVPMEPRGAVALAEAGRLHLIVSGASVHGMRDTLAGIFRLPAEQLRVSAPEVGGGFGVKNSVYPEYVLLLWAARRLGRPVKWIAGRAEDFVSTAHGRDNLTTARLALDEDGRFLALDVVTAANLGAWVAGFGPGTSTSAPSTALGGPYAVPAACMDVHGVLTNTVPIDAYRGAGKPEANYLTERLIEAAARQLGRDPFALRRANLVTTFPYRNALGTTIDSGGFVANLDAAEAAADRPGLAARKRTAAAHGRLRGQGVACYLETSRGQPNEAAELRFAPDGSIALVVGTQSTGMGHATAYRQIAAARLGLPVDRFRYVQADTALVRTGGGHGGARSMHMGGAALVRAIAATLEKARPQAARLLQESPDRLRYADGAFRTEDGRAVTLAAIAADPDFPAPLDTYAENICDVFTFPSGCHVAEVEVDPETGAVTLARYITVDDFGTLINPLLTAGQVQGGLAQGIGQAMLERTAYDPASGQLLSGTLMDYALPRADDLPDLAVTFAERPTGANPLGVKGSGQSGAMIAPQTVMHAILDALAPLGVTHLDMPATPERVWRAIRAAAGPR
ncbi:MAG: xanthine dehydrogenase family protein molybdopterin-binding subunit [Rhodospirillales bacterium]|nr:xanthine dehydrogenase family protein molybdopterin-binding subunit [Rhodospirillales bacterium]